MAKKASKNNKKKSNYLLIIFWFLIFVLLLVVFFAKRNQIKQNLEDTDFFGRVFGKTPEFIAKNEDNKAGEELNLLGAKEPSGGKYSEVTGTEANKVPESEMQKSQNVEIIEEKKPEAENSPKKEENPVKNQSAGEVKPKVEEKSSVQVPKKTEITLYFVSIDSDGSISRKSTKRTLEKSDSPLTDSINALLKGPSVDERGKDFVSLIPAGTRLLGASVKNGTATLNFSENFEFNTFGVEGYIGQLMQIVYTATEFQTVRSVQFLIEGEKKDYLGSEGQWIGTPLARSSF
ncbi:MAG: GerMN domain-containing protein [Treponema sp.]|nr:GerMN domain-containing protein [Treponema sp.]